MTNNTLHRLLIILVLLAIPLAALWAQDEAPAEDSDSPTAEETEAAPETEAGEATQQLASTKSPLLTREESGCITCHLELEGDLATMVTQFQDSIHSEMDFSCTDCHGGDPNTDDMWEAKSEEAGFRGKPDRAAIPELCASCHSDAELMRQYGNIRTDQLDLYKTSQHGMALYENGDTKVATCVDCHTSHNILKVNNPNSPVYKKNQPTTCGRCHSDEALMSGYGIESTIPDDFRGGQHGIQLLENNDMGAPVCNNCHGSHGAMPPGVSTVENVCGTCHLATEKYYNRSRHSEVFTELGFGQCVTCHNPHKLPKPTDNFLSEDATPSCLACHSEGDDQYEKIVAMRESILGIQELHQEAVELVEETEHTTHMSMYDMTPQVEQINTKMLTARAMVHATDPQAMEANFEEARGTFAVIQDFTVRLIDRAKVNRTIVAILAIVLIGFGLFMFVYRRMILDVLHPWVTYYGEAVEDQSQSSK